MSIDNPIWHAYIPWFLFFLSSERVLAYPEQQNHKNITPSVDKILSKWMYENDRALYLILLPEKVNIAQLCEADIFSYVMTHLDFMCILDV